MKALLILAHGSRKQQSNEEVINLAERFDEAYGEQFDAVYAGFMELAQPDINTTITKAIEAGATELIILPYFLAAGAHVVDDIPEIVNASLQHHETIQFRILPHIGGADGMINLINGLCSGTE